ncbi:MAG TPA: hypothetical protein VLB67_11025 [Acidimicrobiia bacterium]|nr:hypothetical protein [Acidimicrobiia bacterium]
MTLEDRIREELSAEAAGMAFPPGSIERVTRRAVRWTSTVRVAAGLAAALAVVFVVALITSPGPTGPAVGPPDEDPGTTVSTGVEPTVTTSAPAGSDGRSTAIATPDGIVLVDGGEVVDHIDLGPVMLAVPDGRGGFVVQIGQSARSILWLSAPGADPVEVVPADAGVVLRLHEVTEIDGVTSVVYTVRRSGPDVAPEDVTEELRVMALDTGEETNLGPVGGYESTVLRVSHTGGRFVASKIAEGYTWFEVVAGGHGGFVNPRTEEQAADDFLVWVGHGVQAADGVTMAFLRGSPRSEAPFTFVVVDLSTGEELMAVPVEGAHETTITRLEWDGRAGIVSLADRPAVVIEDGAVAGTLPVTGIAARGG